MEIKENIFDIMYEPLAGSSISNLLRLLSQNNFSITPRYMPRILYASLMSTILTPFRIKEHFRYHKRIIETNINKDPVFIIGHWRSGTTYLHNVLSMDPVYGFCTTFHATLPGVYLGSEKTLKPLLQASIPSTRPMDNAAMGPDLPQEEEYAIANISPYGYYNGWCFPKNIYRYNTYVPINQQSSAIQEEWIETYQYFIKKLTLYRNGKQLLLKNPAHTARLTILKELYPKAKFIHIYRNPYDVFYSMLKFMSIVLPRYCVQSPPTIQEMKDVILSMYTTLYTAYFEQRTQLDTDQLIEISYEQFINDPLPLLKKIYETLDIEHFSDVRLLFENYIKTQRSFQTSTYTMDNEIKQQVYDQWKFVFTEYGYNK
ncbi:MAG: sulfotransferase [Candidatus Thermoplasmatota archaeon]|nr:sulfotransferase [Candidatus Thermoplasmatota archaeon]